MHAALALFPSVVVLVAVLVLRASGLVAAAAAAAAAALLWLSSVYGPISLTAPAYAVVDAALLTLLVAAMIVPGILFIEAIHSRNSPAAIGALVAAIELSPVRTAILVAAGIGVLVESLTGMGVSLLVTMPLLLARFERRTAIALGLIGMSLMPWGALGISAHVGAKLSGVPLADLQVWIACISGPVAFFLPLLCLLFVPQRTASDIAAAFLAGAALLVAIFVSSATSGIEMVGIAGGIAVILVMTALARSRVGLSNALRDPGLVPYAVLLAAVVAQKLASAGLARLGIWPELTTGRVSFAPLTTPGLALLLATCLTAYGAINRPLLNRVAQRAWRPVVSIALFMFSARLLVECGAISALAASLGGLGPTSATVAVALLGAIGGFVTGSGVTGNALFMASAAEAGAILGGPGSVPVKVLAALQNGASGHFGMAALPVAAILLATLPRRTSDDDASVMRLGLGLATWHLLVAIASALLLLALF